MLKAIVFDWNGTLYDKAEGQLYPGARKVVSTLREKYKLGILSRGDAEKRRELLRALDMEKFFDAIVIAEDKGPEELQRALTALKVTPEETLIVDDYVIRGIKVGNATGCQTCWVKQGPHASVPPNDETGEPTYEIDAIEEILDLL